MTLEQLGNLGEFIGSLAVLATLIYLVLQLRHNTAMMRASVRQARAATAMQHAELFCNSPYLPAISIKLRAGEPLSKRNRYVRADSCRHGIRASRSTFCRSTRV